MSQVTVPNKSGECYVCGLKNDLILCHVTEFFWRDAALACMCICHMIQDEVLLVSSTGVRVRVTYRIREMPKHPKEANKSSSFFSFLGLIYKKERRKHSLKRGSREHFKK